MMITSLLIHPAEQIKKTANPVLGQTAFDSPVKPVPAANDAKSAKASYAKMLGKVKARTPPPYAKMLGR